MTELILAATVFILSHGIPAYRPLRNMIISKLGLKVYLALYTLIGIPIVVWLGFAYVDAPYIEVWPINEFTRWVPITVMPFVCILLVAGISAPNPFSITLVANGYDPDSPGIVSISRHPVFWGLGLWALAHITVNGDAASLILFGMFLALCLFGPFSLSHKRRAKLGEEEWLRLNKALNERRGVDWRGIGTRPLVLGIALYLIFLFSHEYIIGVSPLPL